jgi:outer membrane receptor protein involved in Fe transport
MLPATLLMVLVQITAAGARTVTGTVVDSSGAPVPGARVSIAGQSTGAVLTGVDGAFTLPDISAADARVVVTAAGFAERTLTIETGHAGPVRIELTPRGLVEFLTVSANPEELRVLTSASATVLDAEMLATMPALTLDDQLRTVPGFSLFRRSSSRVANPTTQGVTLRGLAASGASRTVVLADGIPLNDPFGGWVYWDRLPAASLDRVEVARGGSSDLYGSDALGGAVRLATSDRAGARLLVDGGSHGTARASGYAGSAVGTWQIFGAAEAFTTDGFVIVAPEARGPIDTRASSRHSSVYGGTGGMLGRGTRADVRASYFSEDRGNGTPFQINSTIVRQLSGSAAGTAWGGAWTARAFAASQGYDQTFSAVTADRLTERPTTLQHVDTASGGAWYEWLQSGARHAWLLSASWRHVDADLFERTALAPTGSVTPTLARQRTGALVLQASFEPSATVTVGAGARGEIWRSELRDSGEHRTLAGLFPRASIAWRASDVLSLRAAVHNAYRTPTINELYRPFRVGNALTHANAALVPEESIGIEGAALLRRGPAALRVVGFWTRLNDAVVNVTLESSPALIVRERQNAGRIRAAGVEIEADARPVQGLAVTASTAFIDSRFTEGAGLDGLRVPQVPRWQAAAAVHGFWSAFSFVADWRLVGRQFDDDRNQFPLERSQMVNGRAGWRPRRFAELFAAVENAFDAEQDVGRTPIRTIGLPRTVRVGVRLGVWR